MKFNSLQSKINLIFFIAFVLLSINLLVYFKLQKEFIHAPAINAHEKLSFSILHKKMSRLELIDYLQSFNLEVEHNHHPVLRDGNRVKTAKGFESIFYQNQYYFHVRTPFFRLLFIDNYTYSRGGIWPLMFFSLVLIILIVLYLWLRKSLSPLYELKNNITKFANGDLKINCQSKKNDEIAAVANEFDNAVSKINLLLESRQLFLRTIMHELKTPIAKGRIVAELINGEKQKSRMALIFNKLDFLINDFAKVEEVISKNYKIIKNKYLLQSVVRHSKQMLLEECDDKIDIQISSNESFNVDLELMSMVFKNLIDNALKYSDDKCIQIVQHKQEIHFISKGNHLPKTLDTYFKPFHNDTQAKNHGMGLGLYIVKSILDMHGFIFEYEYKNQSNIFKIIYK